MVLNSKGEREKIGACSLGKWSQKQIMSFNIPKQGNHQRLIDLGLKPLERINLKETNWICDEIVNQIIFAINQDVGDLKHNFAF